MVVVAGVEGKDGLTGYAGATRICFKHHTGTETCVVNKSLQHSLIFTDFLWKTIFLFKTLKICLKQRNVYNKFWAFSGLFETFVINTCFKHRCKRGFMKHQKKCEHKYMCVSLTYLL